VRLLLVAIGKRRISGKDKLTMEPLSSHAINTKRTARTTSSTLNTIRELASKAREDLDR
jgi:hypothetical protein